MSFLRATIAPARRRPTVEELTRHAYIENSSEAGRAGWLACAPIIAAKLAIKRVEKKFNVEAKKAAAAAEGIGFNAGPVRIYLSES